MSNLFEDHFKKFLQKWESCTNFFPEKYLFYLFSSNFRINKLTINKKMRSATIRNQIEEIKLNENLQKDMQIVSFPFFY